MVVAAVVVTAMMLTMLEYAGDADGDAHADDDGGDTAAADDDITAVAADDGDDITTHTLLGALQPLLLPRR